MNNWRDSISNQRDVDYSQNDAYKRMLEGEELKYFLQRSAKRLDRMRSGERLFEVLFSLIKMS